MIEELLFEVKPHNQVKNILEKADVLQSKSAKESLLNVNTGDHNKVETTALLSFYTLTK